MKLAQCRIYVAEVQTVLCTDQRNNVDFLTHAADKITSRRVARWVEYMQQFGRAVARFHQGGGESGGRSLPPPEESLRRLAPLLHLDSHRGEKAARVHPRGGPGS